ncbi:MAG: hypothetical protein ACQKBY_13010 [Verrucomicrobiales bacterium]
MNTHHLTTCAATLFFSSALLPGAVSLYHSDSDFASLSSAGHELSEIGWEGFIGHDEGAGFDMAATTTGFQNRSGYFVGSTGSGSSAVQNYLYFQKTSSGIEEMDIFSRTAAGSAFTSFDASLYSTGLTLSWVENANGFSGQESYHFAVEVAGTWYATQNIDGASTAHSIDLNAQNWVEITANVGAPMGLGATTSDSASLFALGDITGIGFYVNRMSVSTSGNRTVRLDNIEITGVPEPSTAVLGLGGLFLTLRRKRA